MSFSLRREYGRLITSGSQLLLLVIGFQVDSPLGMFICLALMAPISLLAWSSAYRRARAIDDTPTSKIASAAQGYVELIGNGQPLAGLPVLSPLNHLPCLWYRYTIERRDHRNNKWVTESQGESTASFSLDDGSGECLVDPAGAEMLITKKESWTKDNRRYTQWLLIVRQEIYVLGNFVTHSGLDVDLNVDEEVKQLLAEWKSRPAELLRRFDLDRNGEIDLREWELAREQAIREVRERRRDVLAAPDLHVMQQPDNGRLYLISDLNPSRLSRRYRLWTWFHIAVFFAALIALPVTWARIG
ncbi:E3 Ubiquitin ligase [Sterolibacterium denitrificans]|uniref:E3 Ubiquitin ligase n=1 Tax=Sterolibacterium denitrificans TaxID=157592 RepID=A0A7Z7MU19_9PROT|nr:hypothetical protein [Sterolibacterium denitrificans]SMB21138.1 E3 Ubiquitin ligase [Sterolibacterium denitrificans]